MRQVYGRQARRTLAEIRRFANADEILQAISQLYQTEPSRVKAEVQKFMDDLAFDVAARAQVEVNSNADPDALSMSIFRLSQTAASTFAKTMSETSLRLNYAIIEDWRGTPGANKADLIDRVSRIWQGPRPAAAATTETTRLVASTRLETYKAAGITQFRNQTRNDDRVRPEHAEYAANSPYNVNDPAAPVPPYGDVNCRCTIVAVIED